MPIKNIRRGDLHPGGRIATHQASWPWIYVGRHTTDDVGIVTQWYLNATSEAPTVTGGGPPNIDYYSSAFDANAFTVSYQGIRFTAESPAFGLGWTNRLQTGDAPLSFFREASGVLHLRGVAIGGAIGSVIFTLPSNYRPEYQYPILLPTDTVGVVANVTINTDGTVVYNGSG